MTKQEETLLKQIIVSWYRNKTLGSPDATFLFLLNEDVLIEESISLITKNKIFNEQLYPLLQKSGENYYDVRHNIKYLNMLIEEVHKVLEMELRLSQMKKDFEKDNQK